MWGLRCRYDTQYPMMKFDDGKHGPSPDHRHRIAFFPALRQRHGGNGGNRVGTWGRRWPSRGWTSDAFGSRGTPACAGTAFPVPGPINTPSSSAGTADSTCLDRVQFHRASEILARRCPVGYPYAPRRHGPYGPWSPFPGNLLTAVREGNLRCST